MSRNAVSFLVDRMESPGQPGAIQVMRHWEEERAREIVGINHACPCGCGIWSWMSFANYGFKDFWEPQPKDGDDLTKLTLKPSIGIKKVDEDGTKKPYHWHGFLEDGVFVER